MTEYSLKPVSCACAAHGAQSDPPAWLTHPRGCPHLQRTELRIEVEKTQDVCVSVSGVDKLLGVGWPRQRQQQAPAIAPPPPLPHRHHPRACPRPLQLTEGAGEIFGSELQLGQKVNVKGQNVAVFSWEGCKLVIEGEPTMMWVQLSWRPCSGTHPPSLWVQLCGAPRLVHAPTQYCGCSCAARPGSGTRPTQLRGPRPPCPGCRAATRQKTRPWCST